MQIEHDHEPLTSDAIRLIYKFRCAVAADAVLDDMLLLITFNKTHGEHAVKHFHDNYATENGARINAARRRIDMLYDSVRVFVEELHVIPTWAVSSIMEPGSVDSFLRWVNPLSVGKPSPKANIARQTAFWSQFGTGSTPAIINHVAVNNS